MNWRNASEFFAMGGYGLYVWGAYGAMLLAMLVEPVLASLRHRAARAAVRDALAPEVEDRP
ncbi:MAG TPA: heme exporter protein CcmD [Burkholderiaceae bacterium]|jgi:heme exporter protein D|nr:heme exporter protein CcmD [Burkholderiaceae bacterium]